jgi:hypothetical protein
MSARGGGADGAIDDADAVASLASMGFDPASCELAYAQARGSGRQKITRAVQALLSMEPQQLVESEHDSDESGAELEPQLEPEPEPEPSQPEHDSDVSLPPPPPQPRGQLRPMAYTERDGQRPSLPDSHSAGSAGAPTPASAPVAAEQLDVLTEENGQLKAENTQLRADLDRATQQITELRRQLQIAASSRTGEQPLEAVPPDDREVAKQHQELEPEPEPEPESGQLQLEPLHGLPPVDAPARIGNANVRRFTVEYRTDAALQAPVDDHEDLLSLLPEIGIDAADVITKLSERGLLRVGDLRGLPDLHSTLRGIMVAPDCRRVEKALADPREFPAATVDSTARRLAELPLRHFLSRPGIDLQGHSEGFIQNGYRYLSDLYDALIDGNVTGWTRTHRDRLDSLAEMEQEMRVWSSTMVTATADGAGADSRTGRASETATGKVQSCYVWQYEGEPGDWVDTPMSQQLQLTVNYLERVPRFEEGPYVFDLTTMQQIRTETGNVRRIQGRTRVGLLPPLPGQLITSISQAQRIVNLNEVESARLARSLYTEAISRLAIPLAAIEDGTYLECPSTRFALLDQTGKPKHKDPRYFRLSQRGELLWTPKPSKKGGKVAAVMGVSRESISSDPLAFTIFVVEKDKEKRAPSGGAPTPSDLLVVPPDLATRREWLCALAAVGAQAEEALLRDRRQAGGSGSSSPLSGSAASPVGGRVSPVSETLSPLPQT